MLAAKSMAQNVEPSGPLADGFLFLFLPYYGLLGEYLLLKNRFCKIFGGEMKTTVQVTTLLQIFDSIKVNSQVILISKMNTDNIIHVEL